MGNCKSIAEQFAAAAKTHAGFDLVLAPLDQAIDELPALAATEDLALIVTSTCYTMEPRKTMPESSASETSHPNLDRWKKHETPKTSNQILMGSTVAEETRFVLLFDATTR